MELVVVDTFRSTLATEWWFYMPILDGDATVTVFVVGPGSKSGDVGLDQWILNNVGLW